MEGAAHDRAPAHRFYICFSSRRLSGNADGCGGGFRCCSSPSLPAPARRHVFFRGGILMAQSHTSNVSGASRPSGTRKKHLWSREEHARALRMVEEGCSGSQIGLALGRSRGAVLGYLHRNGLHCNGNRVRIRRAAKPSGGRSAKPSVPGKVARKSRPAPAPEPVSRRAAPVASDVSLPAHPCVRFVDAGPHSCRFPLSGEPGPDMLVCGAPVADRHGRLLSRTHCRHHLGVMTDGKGRSNDHQRGQGRVS